MAEIGEKTAKADKIVRKYTIGALAVGLVPVPFLDMAALSGIQIKMLHSLANVYEIEFSEELGKSLTGSLLGGGISLSISLNLANFIKIIPFLGLATGMVSMSVFGGASTYAVGKVFIQHFESGGTFLTFDPQQVRNHYAKQFEKGKQEIIKGYIGIKP